jgi:hypothetical protein
MPDQPEPHRLTDDELLQWLVVEAHRQIQERDGVRLLLRPWPPCPVCGVPATSRTTSTSPATFDTTMILKPCSHALVASDFAVAALWPAAQATAEQVANVEAVIGSAVEYTTAKKPSANNPFALLLDQFTANAVQASRAMRADRSDETRTAHHDVAAVWTQAAHLLSQTIKQVSNSGTTPDNPADGDDTLHRAHMALAAQGGKDQATIARVRALAADMRTWCSPHGIASHYADAVDAALNGPQEDGS